MPEGRHALLGPHHACEEEEGKAEEDEAEHGRYFLAHEEVADGHAEEDDSENKGKYEAHDGVEVAELGRWNQRGMNHRSRMVMGM